MEDYTFLRQLADSWGLLLLVLVFVGVVVWVFRPGSRKTHRDTANIPFRHEDRPAQYPSAEDDTPADDKESRK
ncbi:MAG: CcoQ/FixQ family Cbb3-type cytochrome c oxidase assembly chaperone [Jhaorihella sp.]